MSVVQPRDVDKLTIAAARLKRVAPTSWAEFMEAFGALAVWYAGSCVQAPADQILVKQGEARRMLELQTLFTNALAEADRLEQKMKERANGR